MHSRTFFTYLHHLLKPSGLKLIFLLQLPALAIVELISSPSLIPGQFQVLILPVFLYYIAGSIFIDWYQNGRRLGSIRACLKITILLLTLDQASKVVILNTLTLEQSIPLIPDILHLAHAHNVYTSWLFQKLAWESLGPSFIFVVTLIIFIPLTISIYYYYRSLIRRSLFADLAFIFYLGAFTSVLIDSGIRGYTVDFIQLPGYVIADFKDLYLWFGTACLLAELFTSPGKYWKMSPLAFLNAFGRMCCFLVNRRTMDK